MGILASILAFIGTITLLSIIDAATEKIRDPSTSKIKDGDMFSIVLPSNFKTNEDGVAKLIVVKTIDPLRRWPRVLRLYMATRYPKIIFFDIDNRFYVHCKLLFWKGLIWDKDGYLTIEKITSCTNDVLWKHEKRARIYGEYFQNEYLPYSWQNSKMKKIT